MPKKSSPQPAATWTPIAFHPSEYVAYMRPGTCTIHGHVREWPAFGGAATFAQLPVFLMPATRFREQWYWEYLVVDKTAMSPFDPRHAQYDRQAKTDRDGRFEFTAVPRGTYFLLTGPLCQAGWCTHGCDIVRKVEVRDGRDVHVSLNYCPPTDPPFTWPAL